METKAGETPETLYLAELVELVNGREAAVTAPNALIQDLAGYPLRAFEARYLLSFYEASATFHQFTQRPGFLIRRAPAEPGELEALICEPADAGDPFKIVMRREASGESLRANGLFQLFGYRLFADGRRESIALEKVIGSDWSRPTTQARARLSLQYLSGGLPNSLHKYLRRDRDKTEIISDPTAANSEAFEIPQSPGESIVFLYQQILEGDPLIKKPEPVAYE